MCLGIPHLSHSESLPIRRHKYSCIRWPYQHRKPHLHREHSGTRQYLKEKMLIYSHMIPYIITATSKWARWLLKLPASRLFTQPFVQAQIKENIKAPRHWPLWGNSPVIGEFPAHRAINAEKFSISWRHHVLWQIHMILARYKIFRFTRIPKTLYKQNFPLCDFPD